MDVLVVEAPDQPMLVGKRLAHDPHHRTTLAATYDEPRIATITAQLRYLGRQFEDDLDTLPIGAVALFDAQIAGKLAGGLTAFIEAQNLFDRRYLIGRAGIDTIGAPRTIEAGLTYETR